MKTFSMSDTTKAELNAALHGLPEAQRQAIVRVIASLAAEIEIHLRNTAMNDLRQDWSRSLATMQARPATLSDTVPIRMLAEREKP